jgi:hypothetical protein
MYNITLWRVRVTIVAMEAKQCVVCIVDLHVTVNNIKILLHKNAFMANVTGNNKSTQSA